MSDHVRLNCYHFLLPFHLAPYRLPSKAVFKRSGIKWHLDLREGIDFAIYLLGAFERSTQRVYRNQLKPGAVVFDIGANIGAHTLPMAQLVGSAGCIHAFEATAYAVGKLRGNLNLNPDLQSRVVVHHALLTDGKDTGSETEIYSSWPLHGGSQGLHPQHRGRLQAIATEDSYSLDQFFQSEMPSRLDFIKLDVDGHEWPILQGMSTLLDRFRPVILFELAPDYCGVPARELLEFFVLKQYKLQAVGDVHNTMSDSVQLLERIPSGGSINVIARPDG